MRLVIIGAGGFGRTVADVARQDGRFDEICFLDDNARSDDVIGKNNVFSQMIKPTTYFFPAFGNNEFRLSWLLRLLNEGANIPCMIHRTAYISSSVEIDIGSIVMPMAVINTNTRVKMGSIINCGAIIDHDCLLKECVHVCLGAVVKAENVIPSCMKIEAKQVIENKMFK